MMVDNKCVYLHKSTDGVVKYVGSGNIERAYQTHASSHRGKRYADYVEVNGKLEVEIVTEDLSKLQAEDLERELYDKYFETVLNICRPSSFKAMVKEVFDEYFYYDESSVSCLRWRTDMIAANGYVVKKANSEAGWLNKSSGYYQVGFQRKVFLAHRIITVLHGFEVDGFVIDHIDRNRTNNKISNLRVVTQKENSQNLSRHKLSSKNTSGIQGVSYDKQGYWTASWMQEGKQKLKHFPIKNYESLEDAFNDATEYRQHMVDLHYK